MLIFCLTYALFFNKIGYPCRGSLSPSYTRILAVQLYSLFFPILTSGIVYLSSSNSGFRAKLVIFAQAEQADMTEATAYTDGVHDRSTVTHRCRRRRTDALFATIQASAWSA